MQTNRWEKAVVKPAISGGAYNTWITTQHSSDADELKFRALLNNGDVIVQKFVEEISRNGELSLIYFNKIFSHAICKRARQGDFRVQLQFGGTAEVIEPPEEILEVADRLLASIPEPLLYARVDGVITDHNQFMLMELELIEPTLSLYCNKNACENFYQAFQSLVSKA